MTSLSNSFHENLWENAFCAFCFSCVRRTSELHSDVRWYSIQRVHALGGHLSSLACSQPRAAGVTGKVTTYEVVLAVRAHFHPISFTLLLHCCRCSPVSKLPVVVAERSPKDRAKNSKFVVVQC